MSISSGLLFVVIPIALIVVGIWLLRSSYRNPQQQDKAQQRSATRRRQKAKLGHNPLAENIQSKHIEPIIGHDADDADSVLGLKPQAQMQTAAQVRAEPVAAETVASTSALPADIAANYPDMISLYLVAEDEHPYTGYELLQALLSAGLRYGEMQIFHRHENKTGKGAVLFSLASATAPGTFELAKMGSFTTQALCLVLRVKKIENPLAAFDLMVATAEQLVEDLGGVILDEGRQRLNKSTISYIRQLLQNLMESQLVPDLFAKQD